MTPLPDVPADGRGSANGLGVLMVTGAYFPEVSGGGLQCRSVVQQLQGDVRMAVLTTTSEAQSPREDEIDGIPVYRVPLDVTRFRSKVRAGLRMAAECWRGRHRFQVIHLHGFSEKAVVLTLLAKLLRKRLVLTLQTGGHDDAGTIRKQGRLRFWCYRHMDVVTGVSPGLQAAYLEAGLPAQRFRLIPNGADLSRFRPPSTDERRQLRRDLGLPEEEPVVLFVGFCSKEKAPDVLFDAWARLAGYGLISTLVFIGATRSAYAEVDPSLADSIRSRARQRGLAGRVIWVERTHEIERYYRAADVFVMTSVREGMPIALLEAMASGLPCVATRLAGSTDALITNGVNGRLVAPNDSAAVAAAMRRILTDHVYANELGARARQTIEAGYGMEQVASRYLQAYRELTG